MSDQDEFTAQPDELQRVLIQLELLRNADAKLHDERPNWLAARRLAIFAKCCQGRAPLVEVMNTEPPCVLLGQATFGHRVTADFVDGGSERRMQWQGVGQARGGQGLVRLATYERQIETGRGTKQWLWCRHQRWHIDPVDVVALRGEHSDVLQADTSGRTR